MFKKLATGLAVSLFVFTSIPLVVSAQEEVMQTNEEVMTIEETSAPSSEDRAASREERIKALKEKVQEKITSAEERRIAGKCKAAQKLVENLQTRMNTVVEKRREKYSNLSAKLVELSAKLQQAGVDTTDLDAAIADVDLKSATAIEAIEVYNNSLSDLAAMNCEDDPTGFKVVLDEVRTQRTEVIALQGALKSGLNDQVKPALQAARESLQVENADGEGEAQ